MTQGKANQLLKETYKQSIRYNIDPYLILAIMQVESRFNTSVTSPAGARGLMQVMPQYHRDKFSSEESLSDPATGIKVGTQVFNDFLNLQKGDVNKALLAYNGSLRSRQPTYHLKVLKVYDQIRNFDL